VHLQLAIPDSMTSVQCAFHIFRRSTAQPSLPLRLVEDFLREMVPLHYFLYYFESEVILRSFCILN
jgi:hypothetical protein